MAAMTFFILLGTALCLQSYNATIAHWSDAPHFYQGVIISSPQLRTKTVTCDIQLIKYSEGKLWRNTNRHISLTLSADSLSASLAAGDALLFYGTISAPKNADNPMTFDYASWQHRQGISGVIFAGKNFLLASEPLKQQMYTHLSFWKILKIRTQRFRDSMVRHYSSIGLGTKEHAIVSALTLGDKYNLTHDIRTLFSETGASHILALSGLHLGILVYLLLLLLRPIMQKNCGRWIAVGTCITFIWLFTLLTGLNTSLIRAAVMYSITLLFLIRNRRGVPINHLALAAILILLAQPMSLMDIGFQLSFLSVSAILFLQPVYESFRPSGKWPARITDFIYVAVAAQIATAPLVAYTFHILPLSFLLSNLVVIPCAYILLGSAMCLFAFTAFPTLSLWITHLIRLTAHSMLQALNAIHQIPCSSIEIYPSMTTVILCYLLTVACVLLWEKRTRNAMALTFFSIALLAGSIIYDKRPRKIADKVIFYDISSCPAVQFIYSEKESALWMADSMQFPHVHAIAKTFWKTNGISSPPVFEKTYHSRHITCTHGIVRFGGKRYVMVSDKEWKNKTVNTPMEVDILYVTQAGKSTLKDLKKIFKAKKTIIK